MLNIALGLLVFILSCAVAGALIALIEMDEGLGKALRFEIPPWT